MSKKQSQRNDRLESEAVSDDAFDRRDPPLKRLEGSVREYHNKTDLQEAIRVHTCRAGEKLRHQQGLAQAIMVFVQTNRFRQDLPSYSKRLVVPLPY